MVETLRIPAASGLTGQVMLDLKSPTSASQTCEVMMAEGSRTKLREPAESLLQLC